MEAKVNIARETNCLKNQRKEDLQNRLKFFKTFKSLITEIITKWAYYAQTKDRSDLFSLFLFQILQTHNKTIV